MKRTMLTAALVLCFATSALAHFQMVYTPDIALEKGKRLHFSIVFTHPFEAGHTMDMGAPLEFYVKSQKSEDAPITKTDLMGELKPITWKSLTNSGKAYEADAKVRSIGDYAFVLVPEPYFEAEEEIYIQQITKTVVNVAGVPTLWCQPLGLKAEIVPLDKPYALWAGNVFRGVVLSAGKPVPGADIEVEYLNHEPLQDKKMFAGKASAEAPQDSFVTMGIKADANGQFAFGIPKAGFWGFCALGVGPDKEYKGKELSQDAVIWVKAVDM
ncbi:DUF4198 domain-containing protein [Desulfocurvus sp. DL9XJH121]